MKAIQRYIAYKWWYYTTTHEQKMKFIDNVLIAGGMQTPEEFKETYGYSEEEAMEALAALVNHLKK